MKDEERICGLYLRISTEDQAKEGFSLPEQKERLEALCKFKGYKIYDYYTDAGISAKTCNHRSEFDRLIEDAKNKRINTIIALKLDRLSRSIYDWENLLKTSENNTALTLRVKTLNNNIKEKDNEISFLKSKISSLKNTIEYWKDKFDKVISFLYSKLHNWYDKDDKYINVVNDIYEDNVLDDDGIKDLKLTKTKDDFER